MFDVDCSLVRVIGEAHAFDAWETDRENRAVHALRLHPSGPNYRERSLAERDTTPRVRVLAPRDRSHSARRQRAIAAGESMGVRAGEVAASRRRASGPTSWKSAVMAGARIVPRGHE